MESAAWNLSPSDSDPIIPHAPHQEPPEFDITAMVDLVFMMNIYFLVTFILVAQSHLNLPAVNHAAPLDADTAVIVMIERSLNGQSVVVYLDEDKDEPLSEPAAQEEGIQEAVEKGLAAGKTAVLLKAEKSVRLADMFRISAAASAEGMKLHVAVLERDAPP